MVSFMAFQHFPTMMGRSTYSAITIGANGITGAHMVRVLAESPQCWEIIYALSQKPPNKWHPMWRTWQSTSSSHLTRLRRYWRKTMPRRKHFGELKIESRIMDRKKCSDYVFFASYVQPSPKEGQELWSDIEELERVNNIFLQHQTPYHQPAHFIFDIFLQYFDCGRIFVSSLGSSTLAGHSLMRYRAAAMPWGSCNGTLGLEGRDLIFHTCGAPQEAPKPWWLAPQAFHASWRTTPQPILSRCWGIYRVRPGKMPDAVLHLQLILRSHLSNMPRCGSR